VKYSVDCLIPVVLIEKRVTSPPSSLAKYTARIHPLLTQAKILEDHARRREEEAFRARSYERRSILERRSKRLRIRAEILREEAAQALVRATEKKSSVQMLLPFSN